MANPPPRSSPAHLLNITPELRNHIYDLVFAPDSEANTEIDLLHAHAPAKDLLLTCTQIHNEAVQLHKRAHQQYWSTSTFKLTLKKGAHDPAVKTQLEALAAADVQHALNLDIEILPRRPGQLVKVWARIELAGGITGWEKKSGERRVCDVAMYRVGPWKTFITDRKVDREGAIKLRDLVESCKEQVLYIQNQYGL
ncbi:hypothetical protein B0A50_00869 [Salinomyces thailandicus]|uniref:Uncharacterized protein n=1 Tax=Salinomyces thailandicus TaxID=706561 RepID=A0A4U0UFB8_9PEZI|nr:hypothetical protein B0A50_00869 [Salinomyces thailandica]